MAALALSAGDAMASPRLFGPFFEGPSWDTWRAVTKTVFAEPLTDHELALFRVVADRDPPKQRVKEFVAAVGRGGGKDSAASFLAAYVAVTFDPRGRLRPGERASVMCIATDRHQAGIALGYVKGYFEAVPALKAMVVSQGADFIELSNSVTIEVHTASFRGVRGRSILCAILDEAAFFRDEGSAHPDVEIDAALSPGLARIKGSLRVVISSVHKRSGLLYGKIQAHHGKDDPDVLAVLGTTLQFNPSFDAEIIDKALGEDPSRFRAEYLSEWRTDLSSFVDRALIDSAVAHGVAARPPVHGTRYRVGVDASGGRNDSYGFAVAHDEDGVTILDCLVEVKAPFNPVSVTEELAAVAKSYGCRTVVGDRYSAGFVVDAWARCGITYQHSDRDRSSIYLDLLPMLASGRIRLLDNARLITQLAGLERRSMPGGRDRVDHASGRGAADDLCNAAAIALTAKTVRVPTFETAPMSGQY